MNATELLNMAREIFSGKRPKSKTTVDALEGAIADLHRERETALEARGSIQGRRRAALLAGENDAAIAAIEAEETAIDLRLERLELAEPVLRQKLDEARSDARRVEWAQRRRDYADAVAAYLSAARLAVEAGTALVDLRREITGKFAEMNLAVYPPALPSGAFVLAEDMLANFQEGTERFLESPPTLNATLAPCVAPIDWGVRTSRDHVYHPPKNTRELVPFQRASERRSPRNDAEPPKMAMPAKPPGAAMAVRAVSELDLQPGADGLVEMEFLRPFDLAGVSIEPGLQRVTPGAALAAMQVGAADLPARGEAP